MDHGAVPLVAIYDAIPFTFSNYAINLSLGDFFNPAFSNPDIIRQHYENVSQTMGYQISPPGELVDALAHQLLDSKQFSRALNLFLLNLKNYPDSFRSLAGMGDFYKAKNDSLKALSYFKKAYQIKQTAELKKAIDALNKK